MQTGLENVPIFVHPGVPVVYQTQGINIIMTPNYNVPNNFTNQTIYSDKNDESGVNQGDQNEEDADLENQSVCELSEEQTEIYKQKISQHPLFPLLSLLFEICDQSTQSTNFHSVKNVDGEIQNFFVRCHQESTSMCSEDLEVDELMIEAIQVMKIHILELEKVHELCKDFCTRYINCLRNTLHSSQLVPPDLEDDSDVSTETSSTSPMKGTANVLMQTNFMPAVTQISAIGQGQVVSGGTVYQMVQTPHGLVAQPIQIQQPVATSPLSARTLQEQMPFVGINGSVMDANHVSLIDNMYNQPEEENTPKKIRRGVLPKKATRVMKAWLFQHISHPYPTEDEKRQIASQTNLTILQVNNWFINGRRRILQPMLNSGAPEISKSKNRRQAKKTMQRFWPDNIANSKQSICAETEDDGDEDDETDETDTDVEHPNYNGEESTNPYTGNTNLPSEPKGNDCDISAQASDERNQLLHISSQDSTNLNLINNLHDSSDQRNLQDAGSIVATS